MIATLLGSAGFSLAKGHLPECPSNPVDRSEEEHGKFHDTVVWDGCIGKTLYGDTYYEGGFKRIKKNNVYRNTYHGYGIYYNSDQRYNLTGRKPAVNKLLGGVRSEKKYTGYWVKGYREGVGLQTYYNGASIKGIWKRGKLISAEEVLFQTPVAAECADDPNECTLKKLCEVATASDGGNTIWSTKATSAKHVSTAQTLGMECGITPIVDSCDTDPSECKLSQICGKATTESAGQVSWDDRAAAYVAVAKEYGLQCDVNEEAAEVVEWDCQKNPQSCSDQRLCEEATVGAYGDTPSWAINFFSKKGHIEEAKRRGLTCGVDEEEAAAVVTTDDFKQAFTLEPKLYRQQLQYALKKLGFYSYGVDGLWGNGTSTAFDKFVRGYKLQSSTEVEVFRSLLNKVTVPSSFTSTQMQTTPAKTSQDNAGLTSIISNPSVTGRQAIAICGPQAKLAKSQARADADSGSRNRRRTYDMDCSFGSCRARDVTPSGGMWGGILRGLTAANAGKDAYNAVMDGCLAPYGWSD